MRVVEFVTPARRTVTAVLTVVGFGVSALVLFAVGGTANIVLGIFSLAIAGLYTPVAWVLLSAKPALTMSAEGIRPSWGGLIPWDDVEAIAPTFLSTGDRRVYSLGIRLGNPHRYANSFTPAEVRASAAQVRMSGFLALLTGIGKELQDMPADTYGQLAWTRAVSEGFDVVWSANILPQPVHEVAQQVISYGTAALQWQHGVPPGGLPE